MEPETLEALKGSIKKWEAIVAGPEPSHDIGPNACPLCAKFNWVVNLDVPQGCRGCPVQESTGNYGCIGTPYQDYEDAEGDDDPERMFLHAQTCQATELLERRAELDTPTLYAPNGLLWAVAEEYRAWRDAREDGRHR